VLTEFPPSHFGDRLRDGHSHPMNQATAYPGNRGGGFWSTEAEEVHEVDFWTLEDPRGLASLEPFWNEGALSPCDTRSFMHDGVIYVIR